MRYVMIFLMSLLVLGAQEKKQVKSSYADKAKAELVLEIAAADAECEKRVVKAIHKYHSRLDAAIKHYTQKGDLDRALLIRKLRDEVTLVQNTKEEFGSKLTGRDQAKILTQSTASTQSKVGSSKKITITNSNNRGVGDRGVKEVQIILLSNKKAVWKKRKKLNWKKDSNEKTEIVFPPRTKFDSVRIEVLEFYEKGAGLCDIIIGGVSVDVTVSSIWKNRTDVFNPENLLDGNEDTVWVPNDGTQSWIQLDVK